MKVQPLGRIFGIDFGLKQVMFAVVILISWIFLYFNLQHSYVVTEEELPDQPAGYPNDKPFLNHP